jgi:hypothetical protein
VGIDVGKNLISCVAAILVLASVIKGDGLVYQLRADGSFAVYKFELVSDKKEKIGGSLKLSSVGQTTVEGDACRWLEFRLAEIGKDNKRFLLVKVLIAEKRLRKGETPIDHVLKAWRGDENGKSDPIRDVKTSLPNSITAFLRGPLIQEKKTPAAPIESALGKLDCEGITGLIREKQEEETFEIIVENRLHKKAPFGVVSSRMQMTAKKGNESLGSAVMTLNLKEFGTGAKSEMPDRK